MQGEAEKGKVKIKKESEEKYNENRIYWTWHHGKTYG